MSMFASFAAVPKSLPIPEIGDSGEYLEKEGKDGMFDFKLEVVQLGLFVDGKWDKEEFLDLHRGQHLGCLADVIPPEQYYRVMTPEMIAEVEASLPTARRYDAKKRAAQGAGSHPLANIVENETVGDFITRFAASARQALTEYDADHRVVVVVM